jgi:hypothetical protein
MVYEFDVIGGRNEVRPARVLTTRVRPSFDVYMGGRAEVILCVAI